MILSDKTIKAMIASGDLVCEPIDDKAIQPASIDCRLGDHFLVLEDNQLSGCSLDKQEFEPIYPPINSNDLASNQLELLNYLWTKMVEDFIRSIRQAKTNVPTFYDGLKGQQVIDAVRLSDQENKWIQLT